MARTQQLSCSTGKHATSGDCDITKLWHHITVYICDVIVNTHQSQQ